MDTTVSLCKTAQVVFNFMKMFKHKAVWISAIACLLFTCEEKPVVEKPQVLIHYMSWYGDQETGVDSLRHWKFGHANTPLVGYYDSHDKSTLYYHILLAWSSGIDGMVVNVKDEYDRIGMVKANEVITELNHISKGDFDFKLAVSFDDQGFDLEAPLDTAFNKISQFETEMVKDSDHYLHHNEKPIVFSFDYPKKYLTARGLRLSLDSVFGERGAYLIWNTFGEGENTQDYVDAFYPWVQPGGPWDPEGLNWGKPYLDYFYPQVNTFENQSYEFIGGGVWPGFDDRKNTSWGGNRLISRGGGSTYDSTWSYVQNYQGEIPMKYIMIETWNDWNEGTEIEPSVENGFQNLVQTADQILKLQGKEASSDTVRYEAALRIYRATQRYDPKDVLGHAKVKQAVSLFLEKKYLAAKEISERAINQ